MLKLEEIYDVVVAKDGQEAFDMVKESMSKNQYFDLIFMDIQVSFVFSNKDPNFWHIIVDAKPRWSAKHTANP